MRRSTIVLLAATSALLPGTVARASGRINCRPATVPVAQLAPATFVHGKLCRPAGSASADVLVLVPGATYDGTYWDVAYRPATYNFRLAANKAGYATFVLDRLGTGRSTAPPSLVVTHQLQAAAVHGVIEWLNGSAGFARAITVGHSLGSATVVTEAATYDDAAAVLVTGFSHAINARGVAGLFTSLGPAALDPRFRGRDPGYFTTLPARRSFLWGPDDLTPGMRAYDESIKQPVSAFEIATAFQTIAPLPGLPATPLLKIPPTDMIDVPVLSINGAHDKLFCNPTACASAAAFRRAEASYYQASPDFRAWVLPRAGHDINLARNTRRFQSRVFAWLKKVAR